MKLLYIHKNVDAKELASANGQIDLPTSKELDLCSLIDVNGDPLIKLWSEFSSKYFDESKSIFRDSASGIKSAKSKTAIGTMINSTLNNKEAISVFQTSFIFNNIADFSEYSFFAVAKLANFSDTATTTHLFGQVGEADILSYGPSLGFSNTGRLTAYKGMSASSRLAHTGVDYRNVTALFAVTFSVENGLSLRVNGTEVAATLKDNNAVTSPKLPIKLLGNFTSTGGFQGTVSEIILVNKDMLKDKNNLAKIEEYLKTKYSL